MGNIANTYIDALKVRNLTNNPVTLGDLVNFQVPANGTVDLLKVPRVTKEKINQSQHLKAAVDAGILRIIKPRRTDLPEQTQEMILPDLEDIGENDVLSKSMVIGLPTDSEEIPFWLTEDSVTILDVTAVTNLGTLTFTLAYRDVDSAYNYGTAITGNVVADTDSQTVTSFLEDSIPENKWVVFTSSAISGGVTQLSLNIKYLQ